MQPQNNSLASQLIGDKFNVEITFETDSVIKLCVGLLIVTTISLLIFGIIKKST